MRRPFPLPTVLTTVLTALAITGAIPLHERSALATTFIVNIASTSDLYSMFARADTDPNNTYELRLNQGTYHLLTPASNDLGDKSNRTRGCLKLKYGHVVLVGGGYDENAAGSYAIDGGWTGALDNFGTSLLCVGPDSSPSSFRPSLEVRGVQFQNAHSPYHRSAIDVSASDLTLNYVHVLNTLGRDGIQGASMNAVSSTVTIRMSFFENGVLDDYFHDCGGQVGTGGHISATGTTLSIYSSSIILGKACRAGGIAFGASTGTNLIIQNSTIALNSGKNRGGGILISGASQASFLFNTIVDNRAAEAPTNNGFGESRYGGGIGFAGFTGRLIMRGNILARNVAVNQALNGVAGRNDGDDCFVDGSFTPSANISFAANVFGKRGNCTFAPLGRLVGSNTAPLDPRLGPSEIVPRIRFDGLLYMYNSLQPGSVALSGAASSCTLSDDERGAVRVSPGCDIGAFQTDCGHDLCVTGGRVSDNCNIIATSGGGCASVVCAADPHCCSSTWDSSCVAKVPQYCGVSCP